MMLNQTTFYSNLFNMKKSFISTLMVILVAAGTAVGQQIPMFNSYTLNKFLINPSFAGASGKTNIYGINRIQYAGFDGAPVTYMFTADAGFKDKKFGIGGLLYSDRNNLIAQNGFQLSYAYTIKLSDKLNLGMGLNAGAVQWTLNLDQLKVDDPSETVLSNYKTNATTFRSDFGLRLSSEKFELGIAIPQLVSSKVNYSDYLNNSKGKYASIPHYIVNLGYLLALKNDINIKPMVVVRGAKDINPQIDIVGLLDWKSKAYFTAGYRTGYAASIGGGLRLAKGITFGYTYDRPLNTISTYSSGSHEIVVGITLGGGSSEEKPEPGKGSISKEDELKLRAAMEKQIQEKLSIEFENKLKQELELRVNKAVEEKIAKAIESKPPTTTPTDGKITPATAASISKEELEKIKKEIEEKIRKQMDESYAKLVDEKIKKAMESKPATPEAQAQQSKEDTEKARKENEEKIRKEVEEKLRKELTDKINLAVQERMDKEAQKAREEALKMPKEYKMTAKDKSMLDSLKMQNMENQKKIADLEKQIKNFPESDRVENEQLRDINRIVHQNDIELKAFKATNKAVLEEAKDAPAKKSTETTVEPSKFVLVLAGFKTVKEAQQYQKLAAQTFEFPNCKILKPADLDGWYFVYQKTFDKKKMAWEAHTKITESKLNTPNYPWIYVQE
jgi:type IX secretion system PorP/SprF family membrane protein